MTQIVTHNSHRCAHKARSRKTLWARLFAILATQRQRRALGRLDQAHLRDIGLTYDQAQAESQRKLWDVPGHWRGH
jgi:uncharacterized protein YjiS (DUF1127 family)